MELRDWVRIDLEELQALMGRVSGAEAQALADLVRGSQRVFLAGQGRSGLAMRMFAMRLMQLGLTAFVVGDATTPAIGCGDLLVVASGSGETPGSLTAARRSQAAGAQVVALTAHPDSTLGRLASCIVVIPGETPKADARQASRLPMASAMEQAFLILADSISAWLAERMGQTNETMLSRHANLE